MPSFEPDSHSIPDSLFKTASDQATVGVLWVGEDARVRYANPKMASLLGLPLDQLVGQDVQVFDPSWDRKRWPEVWRLLQRNRPFTFERTIINALGKSFPIEVTTSYVEDSGVGLYVAYVSDISFRKRSALRRKQTEDRYRMLVNEASDGIFLADEHGKYIDVNRRGCEMTGFSRDEILSMSIYDLVSATDVNPPIDLAQLTRQSVYVRQRTMNKKDGSTFPAEISAKKLPDGNLQGIVRDVSERIAAERTLLTTLKQTEQVLESVPCGVLRVSKDRHILFANTEAARFFGHRPAELIGKAVTDFGFVMITESGVRYPPGDQILKKVLETGEPYPPTLIGIESPTGQLSWFLITAVPYIASVSADLEAVMVFLNVTKQREDELVLRDFQLKLRLSIETLPLAFWTVDNELRVTSAVGSDLRAFDIEVNRAVAEVFEKSDQREEIVSAHMEALSGKSASIDVSWNDRYYSLRLRPFRDAMQEIIGAVTLAVDITDRKAVEDEMVQLNDSLERRVANRTAELASTVNELESFAYSVSHDLRSPLRAISGFSYMIREDFGSELKPEILDLFERIELNTKRMSGLIDDLLRFSRLGRAPLGQTHLNMKEIVMEILGDLNVPTGTKVEVTAMPSVEGDRGLIRQVWFNLIENSLKFSRTKPAPLIEIGGKLEEDGAHYFVRDNGIGFDSQYSDKLFTVFSRLHSEKEYEGSGIGLATIQRIIARHGGRVWAEGRVGEGSTFWFSLPTRDAQEL